MEAPRGGLSRGARRAIATITVLWALGIVLREPLEQIAYGAAVLLAIGLLVARRGSIPRGLRPLAWVTVSLVAWLAVSPAVAWITGASQGWPPGSRYGSAFEPLGLIALPVLAEGIPWLAIAGVLTVGWLLSTGVALYQHYFAWPWEFPKWMKVSTERVHENFAEPGMPPRYGAGGFLFHRLRFAHAGIALIGPALAAVGLLKTRGLDKLSLKESSEPRQHQPEPTTAQSEPTSFQPEPVEGASRISASRIIAGVLVIAILFGISLTFARAALGAALLVVVAGFLVLARGWLRNFGILAGALVIIAGVSSSGWHERFARASHNLLEGERRLAMTAGLRIFGEHPIAGVGYGQHRQHADALREELHMPAHITWDSHNFWITVLAETGIIGFVLWLAFHALLARGLFQRMREGSWIASGALLSFLGFHVLSLVHYLPFHPSVALAFYFVWGLGLAAPHRSTAGAPTTIPVR